MKFRDLTRVHSYRVLHDSPVIGVGASAWRVKSEAGRDRHGALVTVVILGTGIKQKLEVGVGHMVVVYKVPLPIRKSIVRT